MTSHDCQPACTAGWGPTRRCHCGACGENFSVIANFDKHRVNDSCANPTKIGLVLNERGVWTQPGEVDISDRLSGSLGTRTNA